MSRTLPATSIDRQLRPPLLSFGVPVRNSEAYLPRLLDSLLAQTCHDFEIVICDNDSTDGTSEVCRAYAARDPRVRYSHNHGDIGQIENFNRTFELARGDYFRWIGADDWLEPDYAARCIDALEQQPHAAGVTTLQDHLDDDGKRLYREYRGERLESASMPRRFARMMWAFSADYRFFDPIYSMMRRSFMLRSHRLLIVPATDQVLAAEMITLGPFVHVHACLSHRRQAYEHHQAERVYKRYHPDRHRDLAPSTRRLLLVFLAIPWRTDASLWQKLCCTGPVLRHVAISSTERNLGRLRDVARRMKRLLDRAPRGRSAAETSL